MSRGLDSGWLGYGRFPRVSGDEPLSVASLAASASFSPRERG